jgi:hypothetical protein
MDLSCEITRTCARVLHLTTGTFNLIVKDRIALRLSGAYSVQNGITQMQIRLSSKPFKSSPRSHWLSTHCAHRISTDTGELQPTLGSSFADSKARFRNQKPMPFGTSQGGSKQLEKRPFGGCCDER